MNMALVADMALNLQHSLTHFVVTCHINVEGLVTMSGLVTKCTCNNVERTNHSVEGLSHVVKSEQLY